MIEVRHSKIHGYGVFALRRIRRNTVLIEYLGERISHAEADRRYADKASDDNHTFLFTVDGRTVIDAAQGGNEARYINHSCSPNCESYMDKRRIFIKAVRTIQPGEELFYDYEISRDRSDPPDIDEVFGCRCGAAACRGSMLEARRPVKRKAPGRRAGAKQPARSRRSTRRASRRAG